MKFPMTFIKEVCLEDSNIISMDHFYIVQCASVTIPREHVNLDKAAPLIDSHGLKRDITCLSGSLVLKDPVVNQFECCPVFGHFYFDFLSAPGGQKYKLK